QLVYGSVVGRECCRISNPTSTKFAFTVDFDWDIVGLTQPLPQLANRQWPIRALKTADDCCFSLLYVNGHLQRTFPRSSAIGGLPSQPRSLRSEKISGVFPPTGVCLGRTFTSVACLTVSDTPESR